MAFDGARLGAQLDSIGGGLVRIFGYNSADVLDDLLAADYLVHADRQGVRQGDILLVKLEDAAAVLLRVASISAAGHGTLAIFEDFAVSPDMVGAVGDGVADDTVPIQYCLDNFKYTRMRDGATYKITEALTITNSNRHIIGNDASLTMAAADFDNTTDNFLASNASGLQIKGQLVTPFAQIVNVSVRNLTIVGGAGGARKVDAIVVQNVKKVRIQDCEISGLPLGRGIRFNSVTTGWFTGNHIHDFFDDTDTWTGVIQMTGIEGDGDRTNSVWSTSIKINDNTIEQLNVGAAFEAAFDYQTDGIQVGQGTIGSARGNTIIGVGEGIDWWGDRGTISHNIITDCHLFGIALKHGASYCTVAGNTITSVGVAHLYVGPGVAKHAQQNILAGNVCTGITDSGSFHACLRLDADSTTFKVKSTLVTGNTFIPDGGDYAVRVDGTGELNIITGNLETTGGTATYLDTHELVAVHIPARTDEGWVLKSTDNAANRVGLALWNNGVGAGTGVTLDLNPTEEDPGVRSVQLEGLHLGSNIVALLLKTSAGNVPAERGRIMSGWLVGQLSAADDKGSGTINVENEIWLHGIRIVNGAGSPESAVVAPVGSVYLNVSGGASTTLYVKTSGTGNTGWTAK